MAKLIAHQDGTFSLKGMTRREVQTLIEGLSTSSLYDNFAAHRNRFIEVYMPEAKDIPYFAHLSEVKREATVRLGDLVEYMGPRALKRGKSADIVLYKEFDYSTGAAKETAE